MVLLCSLSSSTSKFNFVFLSTSKSLFYSNSTTKQNNNIDSWPVVVFYEGPSISFLVRYEVFYDMSLTFKLPWEIDWEWTCPIVHISYIQNPNKEWPSKWNCVMKLKQYGYICYIPNVISSEILYFAISSKWHWSERDMSALLEPQMVNSLVYDT